MKIVVISDTHGLHEQLTLSEGDMLIHAGDITTRGTKPEVTRFLEWFEAQTYQYKIFIAGNHDFFFEQTDVTNIKSLIPENIDYLNDSGVTIEGITIWGSPVTPWFFDWAFNRHRGADIKKHWDLIPDGTDILITHGPAYGVLDKTIDGKKAGCEVLKDTINVIKPKVHIWGHIHEAYGKYQSSDNLFINASVLDVRYQMINRPVEIVLDV